MSKRKRSGDASEADAPAAKKQNTDKVAGTSAAERRQLRSERKAKKSQQAKQNASKNRSTSLSEPKLVQSDTVAVNDDLAAGEDFVPLNDAANTAPAPVSASKEKRSSPRSQRKKSKEDKAQKTAPEEHESTTASTDTKKPTDTTRFICFVGNLPYSCTTNQINQHFKKLEPTSIRHSTDKATGKSKGFAFLEFDDYSKMKTCLKVYHHSIFDPDRTSKLPDEAFDENGLEKETPGQNPKQTGRKINVELSAGGGGNSAERKDKIQKKNTKLFEERERRKVADVKQQKAKDYKKKNERSEANMTEIGTDAVHPSRLKRVPNQP